ncbi:MAG: hypothetical protein AUJ52_06395 [Elusimicrobia bacterium CG1_02_63_36]|nr:MAG: hypothetical protein AUJ52_06395 [Elusimicrobia bacterium CG1_02_63_36]
MIHIPSAVLISLLGAASVGASVAPLTVSPPGTRLPSPAPKAEPLSSETIDANALFDALAGTPVEALGRTTAVQENYAPIGYYSGFMIRGFRLNDASGYTRNGLPVPNESPMPLENKSRVRALEGLSDDNFVGSPGGSIDYETKKPTEFPLREIAVSGNGTGGRLLRADLSGRLAAGAWGYRVNAAQESFRPYVREAVGDRFLASVHLDRRWDDGLRVWIDADHQRRSQLSVPGVQALGQTTLPVGLERRKMLNNQNWSEPVRFDSSNIGGGISVEPLDGWNAEASVNRHRAVTDDNAAFPYGCTASGFIPAFCADGNYDLYDYRSPQEVRTELAGKARLWGEFRTGGFKHAPVFELSRSRRDVRRGQEVFEFVGTANLADASARQFPRSSKSPGEPHLFQVYDDASVRLQDSFFPLDSLELRGGLTRTAVSDRRYSRATGAELPGFSKTVLLPSAVVRWSPGIGRAVYASYASGIEPGATAGAAAANAGAILDPLRTRQFELGARGRRPGFGTASVVGFLASKPHEFVDGANALVQRGRAEHSGARVSAATEESARTRASASASYLRARVRGTGDPGLDGKSPVNAPVWKAFLSVERRLRAIDGLTVDGTWRFVARKFATADNTLSVPAYALCDLGLRYRRAIAGSWVTWRLRIENLFDRYYWKDSGTAFGDGYLHLGAPRVYKFATSFSF